MTRRTSLEDVRKSKVSFSYLELNSIHKIHSLVTILNEPPPFILTVATSTPTSNIQLFP